MISEIKKTDWSRFVKEFNATNQLRSATVRVRRVRQNEAVLEHNVPFMGIAITRKGKAIDGIELFTGQHDPDNVVEPVVAITQPARITLESEPDGGDCRLFVEAKDGSVATVELTGDNNPQQWHTFVERVAYSVYERRGGAPGRDHEDWLKAEQKVKEASLQFVE
ncbi:MAG TPA: DUF2934 domain-containing protein [Candidatus Deferrimicrobium sp.]|nr:DUF2934 domain-containing protein [Candidatus Deferrimicrobium sp.]